MYYKWTNGWLTGLAIEVNSGWLTGYPRLVVCVCALFSRWDSENEPTNWEWCECEGGAAPLIQSGLKLAGYERFWFDLIDWDRVHRYCYILNEYASNEFRTNRNHQLYIKEFFYATRHFLSMSCFTRRPNTSHITQPIPTSVTILT